MPSDKHLNVTEIRIVVESGGMESIRDREELEAGGSHERSHGEDDSCNGSYWIRGDV